MLPAEPSQRREQRLGQGLGQGLRQELRLRQKLLQGLRRRLRLRQELRLQQNQVTVLPGSFWHLNSLRHLDLSTNGLLTLALIPPLREHGPVVVPSSSVDEWQEIADPSAGPGSTVWVNPRTGEAQRWRPWTDDTAPKQKAVQAATQAGEGQDSRSA